MKRKIVYALLAILVAFGLWLYVVTVVNPEWEETFYNIPVVLENEEILTDRGLMLSQDTEPKITIRLSGNRTDMMKLNSGNITLIADLSKIYSPGEQSLGYSIIYPGDVPSNAFKIISQTPQMLTLSISEWKSKEVEVQVAFTGAVPENYFAFKKEATLDYEKVTVTGPADVIDRIAFARVEVNLEDQTETISRNFDFTLCDADGNPVDESQIKTNRETVQYTLKIQRWKEIELRLDILGDDLIQADDCVITIANPTIQVSGTEQMLASLDYLVLGQVKLWEETEDIVDKVYKIVMPEGVTNLSGERETTVSIDIPEMEMREFTVTDIQAINVPAGMTVKMITQEKVVTVRGAKETLDAITELKLLILVDFSDAEEGNASFEAQVLVADEEMKGLVGIVGSYDVNATVTGS